MIEKYIDQVRSITWDMEADGSYPHNIRIMMPCYVKSLFYVGKGTVMSLCGYPVSFEGYEPAIVIYDVMAMPDQNRVKKIPL